MSQFAQFATHAMELRSVLPGQDAVSRLICHHSAEHRALQRVFNLPRSSTAVCHHGNFTLLDGRALLELGLADSLAVGSLGCKMFGIGGHAEPDSRKSAAEDVIKSQMQSGNYGSRTNPT